MATIICIEDEAILRKDISEELEDEGYNVIQASDGVEGLQAIVENKPDLVVCDITMPRKNGYELLRELRENHPEFAEMPFIFLSALSDRNHVIEGLNLGADDYLSKPIDFDMLLVKISASLRQIERMNLKKIEDQKDLFLLD